MARILTCGFEENKITAGAVIWSGVGSAAGAVQTTTVHSGTYAWESATGAAHDVHRQLSAALTSGTIYVRFYFRMAAAPSATRKIFENYSTGIVYSVRLSILTTGVIRLTNVPNASATFDGPTLAANTWYRIEIRHLISDTVGQMEVRVFEVSGTTETEMAGSPWGDGNFAGGDGSDADTLGTGVQRFAFGNADGSWGASIFIDDVALNDTSGSFQTSWPGAGKIAFIEPASDTSITWEDDDLVAAATFANINELPGAAVDTAYNVETVTLNSIDQFGITALPAEVPSDADMILMDLYARVGSDQANAATARFKIWDETPTLTTGPNIDCGINGWRIGSVGTTNEHQVFDLGTRTPANVNSFNIGYENLTDVAGRDRRVSTLWANVEWIEGAGGGEPGAVVGGHRLILSGVLDDILAGVGG